MQVINTLDPKSAAAAAAAGGGGIEMQALRNQLQEKERLIQHIEVRSTGGWHLTKPGVL